MILERPWGMGRVESQRGVGRLGFHSRDIPGGEGNGGEALSGGN
jgi:hypothetical protein